MPDTEDTADAADTGVPQSIRAAAVVLALQAAAFVVLAVIVVIKVVSGHPASVPGALLNAALSLLAALILLQCGRALLRLRPAARTPVVVVELLALPVSYTLAFSAHRPEYGAPILISALAVLYLLFTPASRAALDR